MHLAILLALVVPDAQPHLLSAAAAVRVGDAPAAFAALAPVEAVADPDVAAARAVLAARAHLLLGQPRLALDALGAPLPEALHPVAALYRLRAAVDLPPSRARLLEVRAAADALLAGDATPAEAAEARFRRAEAALHFPAERGWARAELWALADATELPSVRPRALAALDTPPARRRLYVEHGETAGARALSPPPLSADERVARARALFVARAYELAEPALRAVAGDPAVDAAERQRAHHRLGIIRLRLRSNYEAAIEHLEAATRGPDEAEADRARFRLGVALGQLERWDEAIAVMRATRGRFSTSAGYQVGRLMHQAGRYAEAVAAHTDFLARRRRDHAKYEWFLGWAHFREGDCPSARRVWDRLAPRPNLLEGAKALYWTARCFLLEDNPAAAKGVLDTLRERAPLSYYGLLGARLAARHFGGRARPERPRRWPLAPAPAPDLRDFERRLAGHTAAGALRAVRLLVWSGHPRRARRIEVELDVRAERRLDVDALEVAFDHLLERFGARWQRARQRRLPWRERLAERPDDVTTEALPAAYLELARAAGAPHGVSPWWLLAHMLQESRFRERARSHAGALGPMQVLPRTGRRIAARLGFPAGDFFDDQLFEPGVALRHAAWYLGALRREFGHPLLAIGAYNGGPLRLREHLRALVGQPFDVMVEEIGAHEMRNYLRKVADHAIRYASLYGTDAERAELLDALAPLEQPPPPRGELDF